MTVSDMDVLLFCWLLFQVKLIVRMQAGSISLGMVFVSRIYACYCIQKNITVFVITDSNQSGLKN